MSIVMWNISSKKASTMSRTKEIREKLGLSQQDFADKIGEKRHKIADIETNKQKLPIEIAGKIEEIFHIDPWWLLTGKGQMLVSKSENTPIANDGSLMNIQRVSPKASAGGGNHLESIDQFEVVETMTISRSLLKTQPNGTLRLITVDGHSMVPMLYPDSLVLFDEHPEWRGDGLYILNWRNELMVKLLQIDPRGQLHIKSANKDYESWTVDPDDQSVFHIVGKVLRIII